MDETLMIFAPRVINGITVCVTMVSARTLRSTTRITSAEDAPEADIARRAAARVIDEHAHVGLLLGKLFAEIAEAFGVEQVQAHADEFLVRELLGQLFKLAHAAGDEPEFLDLREFPHKLARELRAEPGGRAGNDGRGHPRP